MPDIGTKTVPYALTTVERVRKDILGIDNDKLDSLIALYINGVTDYIQRECSRFFMSQVYANDIYSAANPRQIYLILRHAPVTNLAVLEYRAGTPSNPNWTAFIPDQYELINPQPKPFNPASVWYPEGTVRVYGVLPGLYNNSLRATYTAGYLIDWKNVGDPTKHELPSDLSNLCESLVVRRFKRRDQGGKSSTSLEGSTISWRNLFEQEDLDIMAHYRRPLF